MAKKVSPLKAKAAWDRLMALGGTGVWDSDIVTVSLADTGVTDDDLAVFRDFPNVQVLDLSRTAVTAAGLAHLSGATALAELIVVGTKLNRTALTGFRAAHPAVKIVSKLPSASKNPFNV
jgi:hypothetical protein